MEPSLRVRSADHQGRGPHNQNCQLPFTYHGESYEDCTEVDNAGVAWCSVLLDTEGRHQPGHWGNCGPLEEELAQQTFSNSSHTCQDTFHICSADANYGYIKVDFVSSSVEMGVRTPAEQEVISHKIHY